MGGTKTAVVTGASGALGLATVDVLAGRGMTVVGVDRDEEVLRALPETVHREAADLTDRDAAAALFDRIGSEVGTPDVVVNTIGGFAAGQAADTTAEGLGAMLTLNLDAAWWVSQAAARLMRPRGSGALVHVAAKQGLDPPSGAAAYAVSKAALVQLVRVLDAELGPDGIRVNAVVPRLIDTPANRAALPTQAMAGAVAPAAIARVIAFLASDTAAPVSGALVPVYGLPAR